MQANEIHIVKKPHTNCAMISNKPSGAKASPRVSAKHYNLQPEWGCQRRVEGVVLVLEL